MCRMSFFIFTTNRYGRQEYPHADFVIMTINKLVYWGFEASIAKLYIL